MFRRAWRWYLVVVVVALVAVGWWQSNAGEVEDRLDDIQESIASTISAPPDYSSCADVTECKEKLASLNEYLQELYAESKGIEEEANRASMKFLLGEASFDETDAADKRLGRKLRENDASQQEAEDNRIRLQETLAKLLHSPEGTATAIVEADLRVKMTVTAAVAETERKVATATAEAKVTATAIAEIIGALDVTPTPIPGGIIRVTPTPQPSQ